MRRGGILPGYTLVETVMVLVFLGLVLAAGLPATAQAVAGCALNVAASRMLADVREAREQALAQGTVWSVRFYPETESYRIYSGSRVLKSVKLPSGVDLVWTNFPNYHTLTFTASGAPSQGGHVSLTVDNRAWRYVIVMPVTGRVRVDTVPP